jgi:hypothetical protein
MLAGLTFSAASMADSSGIASYTPISGFTPVGAYGQGLSTADSQKWPSTFGSGMPSSSQGGGSSQAVALQTLDNSALARNIEVGLNAGTTAAITGNASNYASSTGSLNSTSQSSNVVLVGK